MKIKVNEKTYSNCTLSFNMERGEAVLIIQTDESIGSIAGIFDGKDTIRAFDDNNIETGVWYVHQLVSIYENYESRTPESPREVCVALKASALNTEAEAALGNSIDENMEAILELAGLISDMDEANIRINNLEGIIEGIPKDIVDRFAAINNLYNALADRVAKLENKEN